MRSGRWSTEFLGMSFHKWRLGFQQIGSSLSMKKKEKDGLVTMWNQSCPFYYIIPKKLLHDFCNDKKRNPTASRSSHYGCLLKSYSSELFQTFPFRSLLKDHFFYLHTSPNLVQQHFSSFSPSFFSQNPTSSSLESPRKMRGNPTETPSSSNNHPPNLKLIDCFLRLFVIPLSVATIWLTVTNQQENSSFGLLKYSNLLGLKYMVCISAISTGYAFVAIVSTWIRFLVSRAWLFFLSDQIVAYLMVTSGAAVMEILYLAYNGDQKVTWSEACSSYGKFCYRMKLALIFHVLALGCFIVLAVISAYRCFCLFDPPLASKEVEEEETN